MIELLERIERLEQANVRVGQAREAAERRARRWQLAAGALLALGLGLLPLRTGNAQGGGAGSLVTRVEALEATLTAETAGRKSTDTELRAAIEARRAEIAALEAALVAE